MRRARLAVSCLSLAAAAGAHAAFATGDAALLGIRINDIDQPDAVMVLQRAAHAPAVPLAALAAWRVRRPADAPFKLDGIDFVDLASIAGARWHEEASTQTLVIDLPSAAFLRNDFEVVNPTRPSQALASVGGFINYDLQWLRDAPPAGLPPTQAASGLFEAGVFSAQGNGVSSGVWRSGDVGGVAHYTRLDTNWNMDLPASLASVRVGDAISSAGAWGRSVRYGGVQWATNFAVQPGLLTFPMPAVKGDALVPSVVDLYINNVHQLQGQVPAGAFDLPDVPVVAGQGQIRLVVRDLLGREHVVVQPYYLSTSLLKPGLRDFALEAGTLREDYGLESQHYGRAFFAATDRVGVTTSFTREVHAEVMRDRQALGLSGAWTVWDRASLNASVAASHGPEGNGALASAGVDHQATDWSAHAQLRGASRAFTLLGSTSGVATLPRVAFNAGIGGSVGRGSVGLDWLQQTSWDGTQPYRTLTLNYAHQLGVLGNISLYASKASGAISGTTVGVNFVTVLDGNGSANLGSYRSRDRIAPSPDGLQPGSDHTSAQSVLQLQGNPPVGPGFGYQVMAERGGIDRFSAEGTAQNEFARMSAGVGRANGTDSIRLGASGAIALMPEGVYFSRRVDGSFAVVQVGDYPGVRIDRDNQFVAVTDAHGRAFVGGLRGFESNQISVEAGDLPLDAQVEQLKIEVAPGMRSGVSVRFPVQRSRAASLRLVDSAGEPLPAGVYARLAADPTHAFPIGFDGRLFLAGLHDRDTIAVQWGADGSQHCEAQIELAAAEADDVPELGTHLCK